MAIPKQSPRQPGRGHRPRHPSRGHLPSQWDVLAPEGHGPRADLTTTPPGRTLEVPGGTQALIRTELIPVRVGDAEGFVFSTVADGCHHR